MARTKSEILSDMGTWFEIMKALVNAVLDAGGTDNDLRGLLTPTGYKKLQKIGKYIVELVPEEPVWREKHDEVHNGVLTRLYTCKFGRDMDESHVLMSIDHMGYRLATAYEVEALWPSNSKAMKIFIFDFGGRVSYGAGNPEERVLFCSGKYAAGSVFVCVKK